MKEQVMKFGYSYFIHPFVINGKYSKFIMKLMHNKKCKLHFFNREKDAKLYTYFLPKVKDLMFWSLDYSPEKIKSFNAMDDGIKNNILSTKQCVVFDYILKQDMQGKIDLDEYTYFNISKIQVICFKEKIGFVLIKAQLPEGSTLQDLCNFNYLFRDINVNVKTLRNHEKIKIQAENFSNIDDIGSLIDELTDNSKKIKKLNYEPERLLTYSYACIGQEDWNEQIEKEFYKFKHIKSATYNVDATKYEMEHNLYSLEDTNNCRYGITKYSTVLLTNDLNADNYTYLLERFQNEYLYNYIYVLYKELLLRKISNRFKKNNLEKAKNSFVNYSDELYEENATNSNVGGKLSELWENEININRLYKKAKEKYDIIYKNSGIQKNFIMQKVIIGLLVLLLIVLVAGWFI